MMHAVIFEVWPKDGKLNDYLKIAAILRSELSSIDGFISVERFQSLTEPGKYLSVSFWRDEAAITAWREHGEHRSAQKEGREYLFADFRIRVAAVVRDYGMADRRENTSVRKESGAAELRPQAHPASFRR